MFEWNWADLIIAFLGFLTAIGAAFFTNKILDYIKCKKTVNKIKKELEQEFEDKKVEENINRILSLDDHNFKLVEMPYIESVCKSNLNECVMNIFWFCDLITIVNSIDEINQWTVNYTLFKIKMASSYQSDGSEESDDKINKIKERFIDMIVFLYKRIVDKCHALYIVINKGDK